jgi:hypothetical protein
MIASDGQTTPGSSPASRRYQLSLLAITGCPQIGHNEILAGIEQGGQRP